jgi:hypothetical protein
MATTYTFIGADFKAFKYDDFHAEDDEPMTYQVYSSIHIPNSENISKSRTTLLKGKEDDKPMTHNFNSSVHARNSENISAPLFSGCLLEQSGGDVLHLCQVD